eukprot:365778_1
MYRGVSNNFIFSKFIARCHAPVSTSTSLVVAATFAKDKGMILELSRQEDIHCFYFDCRFVSAFNESECLFFGGDTILKIITIKRICNNEWVNYIYYLQAIHFLITLMKGGDCDQIVLSLHAETELNRMVKNHLSKRTDTNIPHYIYKLFNYHISSTTDVLNLNIRELKEKRKFLANIFTKSNGMLDITRICECFYGAKNVRLILPKDYKLDVTFIESLVEDLYSLKMDETKNMRQLTLDFQQSPSKHNKLLLNGCYNEFQKANWEIQYFEDSIQFIWVKYIAPKSIEKPKQATIKATKRKFIDKHTILCICGFLRRISKVFPTDIQLLITSYYPRLSYNSHNKFNIWFCSWNMSFKNRKFTSANIPRGYNLYVFGIQQAVSDSFFKNVSQQLSSRGFMAKIYFDRTGKTGTGIAVFYPHWIDIEFTSQFSITCGLDSVSDKGASCVLFRLYATTIALLSVNISNETDFETILNTLSASHIASHIVCFGNFDSKLKTDFTANQVFEIMKGRNLTTLWNCDSLSKRIGTGVYKNFYEPIPRPDFCPTFPKEKNTIREQSKECVIPTFCDRLIYYSESSGEYDKSYLYPERAKSTDRCHNYGCITDYFLEAEHIAIYCGLEIRNNSPSNEKKINNIDTISPTTEHKIVLFGASGVGKSALVIRFVTNQFFEEYDPTIYDSYRKRVMVDGKQCLLDILDTAGMEEYCAMQDQWMREGDVFILVYAINSSLTFDDVLQLREKIIRCKDDEEPLIVVVGNKCDREDERQVQKFQGQKLAKQWGDNVHFMETSMYDHTNHKECFYEAVRLIHQANNKYMKMKPNHESKGANFCIIQ